LLKNIAFKHRIIGAIFIISLGVIIIPAILDRPAIDTPGMQENLPAAPSSSQLQSLDEVDYSFTELVDDLREQEVNHGATQTSDSSDEDPVITDAIHDLAPLAMVDEEEIIITEPQTTAAAPVVDIVAQTELLIVEDMWAVQLGAFSKSENAQALMERLQGRGYAAYVQELSGTQLTRVLVGSEAEQGQAAEILAELDDSMNLKGIIVKFDPAAG